MKVIELRDSLTRLVEQGRGRYDVRVAGLREGYTTIHRTPPIDDPTDPALTLHEAVGGGYFVVVHIIETPPFTAPHSSTNV